MKHITVLQQEAVEALAIKPASVIVDATYGGGGHAKLICERLGAKGVYVGIDVDETAFRDNPIQVKNKRTTIHQINDNFSNLEKILSTLQIDEVDGILADLGWRTDQFTESNKGFSFQTDEPLTMTYGKPDKYLFTAYDLVNGWAEADIANVLYGYGDERHSRRIASAIVKARAKKPIETSSELEGIIVNALPKAKFRKSKIHPATKSFQAIRIAVNDELKVLEDFIDQAVNFLRPDGRLAIISFHSTEDRIVKLKFRDLVSTGNFSLLTKKPLTATDEELESNPRARSAKLRILIKTDNTLNNYEY